MNIVLGMTFSSLIRTTPLPSPCPLPSSFKNFKYQCDCAQFILKDLELHYMTFNDL